MMKTIKSNPFTVKICKNCNNRTTVHDNITENIEDICPYCQGLNIGMGE